MFLLLISGKLFILETCVNDSFQKFDDQKFIYGVTVNIAGNFQDQNALISIKYAN